MARPKIVVVGSSNTDMVVRSPTLPGPGETVLGGEFLMSAGGKGANQAVAAARAGAEVTFVACVGDERGGVVPAGFNAAHAGVGNRPSIRVIVPLLYGQVATL